MATAPDRPRDRQSDPVPEADSREQAAPVADDAPGVRADAMPSRADANAADAWEQAQEVPHDEDDR